MKKGILKLFFLALLITAACDNEPVGLPFENIDVEIEDPDKEIENPDLDFGTGGICFGNGVYQIDPGNLLMDYIIPEDLPDNHDLSDFLPPIASQGGQGSCVSWAISYYMKSLQKGIKTGEPLAAESAMSPAYTYNQISKGNCIGTQITQTLEILKIKGVCTWDSFPYTDTDCSLQPTKEQDQLALTNKISDYKGLTGENMVLEMKALINEQTPIIIGAYLSSEFGKVDEFGLRAYREHTVDYSLDRCHAMLVVGYSDPYNAFKVVNSWGENWGDNGFVWIDYKAFENVVDETAEFRVINQAYIAYDLE